jgi:hypothetical protein
VLNEIDQLTECYLDRVEVGGLHPDYFRLAGNPGAILKKDGMVRVMMPALGK